MSPDKQMMKGQLKPEFQTLIMVMQKLNFGKIKNMAVRDGLPVLRPAPLTIREVKLGNESRRRPEINLEDFALKSEVRDMVEMLSKMRNGVVLSLQVRNGLPCLIKVQESVN